jgi:hypothetical protein
MTRETTDFETPAVRATSMIVAGRRGSDPVPPVALVGLDMLGNRIILAGTFPLGTFPMALKDGLLVRD